MGKLLVVLFMACSIAIGAEIEVKTGYGYLKDSNGDIIEKMELPAGFHPLEDGYTYIEVNTKTQLDKIIIKEKDKTQDEIYNDKIEEKTNSMIRQQAIDALKVEGELPPDYTED